MYLRYVKCLNFLIWAETYHLIEINIIELTIFLPWFRLEISLKFHVYFSFIVVDNLAGRTPFCYQREERCGLDKWFECESW